jgi:hypothetical protein
MKTCTDCPAYRIPSTKPHGYCPIGFEQIRKGYIVMPKGNCPKPETHVKAMTLYEEHRANDEISEGK